MVVKLLQFKANVADSGQTQSVRSNTAFTYWFKAAKRGEHTREYVELCPHWGWDDIQTLVKKERVLSGQESVKSGPECVQK